MKLRLAELQTPALVVRMDRVRANLERMRAVLAPHGGFERWRPHVKTAKTPAVLRLLLESGLRRFKCATTREAAVLLECAERARLELELCVALAHRGPNLARLAQLARAYPSQRLSLLCEAPEHAREIRAAAPTLGIWIDLDPGMGRSGIALDDQARLRATLQAAGDALVGLHAYEGQIRNPLAAGRARACAPHFERLVELARANWARQLELVTSGTPTFEQALAFGPFAALRHRVSPGIVVYWDTNSEALGIEGFRCAASVLARVISSDGASRVTLDAGSKSLDAAAGDPCVRVRDWPNLVAQRPSEEHLPLVSTDGRTPRAGELVELLPRHVCPMVNLASRVALLEGDELVGLEDIAARGHELAAP